ncbi:MAG: hypothetical protein HY550_09920 [Elusimicrobia bacterium]|nr:hypothetical protein [Elusimicrobiota bacterium]
MTEGKLTENLADLVDNYRGDKLPEIYVTGARRSLAFEERIAGVSTVTITGPYGVVYNHVFAPPIPSTGLVFINLPPGSYKIQSYNSVGGKTENLLKVAEVEPEILSDRSHVSYDAAGNVFNVKLSVNARASEGIHKLELIQNGKIAGVLLGKGTTMVSEFQTRVPTSSAQSRLIVQLSDLKGNCRQIRFYLDIESLSRMVANGSPAYFNKYTLDPGPSRPWRTIPEGKRYSLQMGNGIEMAFENVIKTGEISYTWTTSRPPNGYFDAFGAAVILKGWNGLEFGSAEVSMGYGGKALTPDQISALKIVRVEDPRNGIYSEMPAKNSPKKHEITAKVQGPGKFMLVAQEYSSGHTASGRILVAEKPEIDFLSGLAGKTEVFDLKSEAGLKFTRALKQMNKLPVSTVYRIWPENTALEPSGALKMRYSDKVVASLGIKEDTLALYTFALDGESNRQLPYLTLDKEGNVLTARVPQTHQLFAIVGSSVQAENIPPLFYPDGISPVSRISFSGSKDGLFISTRTLVVLTAEDPQVPDVLTSEVANIFYFLQTDRNINDNVQISTYTQPFTIEEGSRTIIYMALDKAGNYEFPRSTIVYADGTAPKTTAAIEGKNIEPGETVHITEADRITLASSDPLSNGVSSRVHSLFYSIDNIPADSKSARVYSNPFNLIKGTHIVYYMSLDNVGNLEMINSITAIVSPGKLKRK